MQIKRNAESLNRSFLHYFWAALNCHLSLRPTRLLHWVLLSTDLTVHLTLSPPSTTVVPYANSLDLDETPSYSASHPDPSCLTLRRQFYQLWTTLKQMRNLAVKIYLTGYGLSIKLLQTVKNITLQVLLLRYCLIRGVSIIS